MMVFCCSSNLSLLKRWQQALDAHTVYQASRLEDINVLLKQKITPQLMLLHASMVNPESCLRLRSALPGCRLFVLSDRPDDSEGLLYLGAGAVGYGNSYIAPGRLVEAVRAIGNGSVWVGQRLMERLVKGARHRPEHGTQEVEKSPAFAQLSQREHQITCLVAEGLSNAQIGAELGITERTVKAHLSSIYQKTGARGRLNLALLVNRS
jgi:DNA-binding NarL/FixJ family response regulator